MKCGCHFVWLKLDTSGLTPSFWICCLLPGILDKFFQQALRVMSRQNSSGKTVNEADEGEVTKCLSNAGGRGERDPHASLVID